MNKLKKNYLLINILPVFLHLFFLPFWFSNNTSIKGNARFLEICYHLFFCLVLIIINFLYAMNKKKRIGFSNYFLMISLTAMSVFMFNLNYDLSTGRFFSFIYKEIMFLWYLFIIPAFAITFSTVVFNIFYKYIIMDPKKDK